MSYELIALVLIALGVAVAFSVGYWALRSVSGSLAKIIERSERLN